MAEDYGKEPREMARQFWSHIQRIFSHSIPAIRKIKLNFFSRPSVANKVSNSIWETLKEFVRSVGKWWWAVTIDWLVGAFLGTAQSFGHALVLPSWVPYLIVITGFVAACFIAFHRLRIERDEAVKKLSESLPSFKGELQQIIIGEGHPPDGNVFTRIVVKMQITNRGAPSIAQNFLMCLKFPDGRELRGDTYWDFNEDLKIPNIDPTRPTQILRHDRYLPTLAMTPISKGGLVYGYFAGFFRGISLAEVSHKENMVIIHFDDIENRNFSCEYSVIGNPNAPKMELYPGDMGTGIIPPPIGQ
jgi:hypothetical protein